MAGAPLGPAPAHKPNGVGNRASRENDVGGCHGNTFTICPPNTFKTLDTSAATRCRCCRVPPISRIADWTDRCGASAPAAAFSRFWFLLLMAFSFLFFPTRRLSVRLRLLHHVTRQRLSKRSGRQAGAWRGGEKKKGKKRPLGESKREQNRE